MQKKQSKNLRRNIGKIWKTLGNRKEKKGHLEEKNCQEDSQQESYLGSQIRDMCYIPNFWLYFNYFFSFLYYFFPKIITPSYVRVLWYRLDLFYSSIVYIQSRYMIATQSVD